MTHNLRVHFIHVIIIFTHFFIHIYDWFFFAPTLFWVLSGCILLSIQSAAIGCFTVLNKQSLAGDAVAHAVLPGICIAFLLTGEKDGLLLLISASISGWIALQTIQYISQTTKIKTDASIGIILSVFLALVSCYLHLFNNQAMVISLA